jgi:hypothetical protein
MKRVLRRTLKKEGAKAPSLLPYSRSGTIYQLESRVKAWMIGACSLRVQPATEGENDFVEGQVEQVEMMMVNRAMMPHQGESLLDYLHEFIEALEAFGIAQYVNRFTSKEELSDLICLAIQCLFDEEDQQIRIGFNAQHGVFVFNARVGEEAQQSIDLSWFHKTRFFPLISIIAQRAIDHNIMHDAWSEYSDIAIERIASDLDEAISIDDKNDVAMCEDAMQEDWRKEWFVKMMRKAIYSKPERTMKEEINRLKLPEKERTLLLELNEMFNRYSTDFLPYVKYFEGNAMDLDESYMDSVLHPVFWGRNSDYLLDQMNMMIDSIHGECWVSEYSNIIGVENGKLYVDKVGSRAYVARYNIRKTITQCVNLLTPLMTERQRSRSGLLKTSLGQKQP